MTTAQRLDAALQWHMFSMGMLIALSTARLVSDSPSGEMIASWFGVMLAATLGAVGYQLHCAREASRELLT